MSILGSYCFVLPFLGRIYFSFPKFISPRHAYHLLNESEVITGESQTEVLMYQYVKAEVWDFPVMTERRLVRYLSYGLFGAINSGALAREASQRSTMDKKMK